MKDNLIITPADAAALEKSLNSLSVSVDKLRKIAYSMIPVTSLDEALRNFCAMVNKTGAIRITYVAVELSALMMTHERALVIYNAIQELIVNILKHSNAKTAALSVEKTTEMLLITVSDNGEGFDEVKLETTGESVYKKLESEFKVLNGSIEKQTIQQKGTRVNIQVPFIE